MTDAPTTDEELDVRGLPKPDKHPTIFAAFEGLPAGGAMVLVNDHDPKHLHDEFETELAGSYTWEYMRQEPRDWRIRIGKLTATPLPRVLVNTRDLAASPPDTAGAVWKLEARRRDLDSNVVALPPQGRIDAHAGPELDVLIHVVSGAGELVTENGSLTLEPGAVVWLPRRSRREFRAGPEGLRYLTVHQRRQALVLMNPRTAGG
jgi:uncharacterized protein (DUF2249 family)/quercetin dioxygenase-like cupin family protein